LIVAASVAVYIVDVARAEVGTRVALRVDESYETDAGTSVPSGFFSVKLEAVIVLASIPREKVAFTVAAVLTPVFPSSGDLLVTVGGVPGGGAVAGMSSSAVSSGSSAPP
jgi:hypothetical protein